MSMSIGIRIRGIYSTALTALALEAGWAVTDPSPEIQSRFGLAHNRELGEITVSDRDDLQGVDLNGTRESVAAVRDHLLRRLFDAVCEDGMLASGDGDSVETSFLFPGAAKQELDALRASVVPTISGHHRFRIVNPQGLDVAEQNMPEDEAGKEQVFRMLFEESILLPLRQRSTAWLYHIKVRGRKVAPRAGTVVALYNHTLMLKRMFARGWYDGLNLPIEDNDYGLTVYTEGAWHVRHFYFSGDDRLKGCYVNINTPVEFYPEGARYVDLEVDIIQRTGEQPFLIDAEELRGLCTAGCIHPQLEQKALAVAESIMNELSRGAAGPL